MLTYNFCTVARRLLVGLLLVFPWQSVASSAPDSLKFAITYSQELPFYYYSEKVQLYLGIMPDISKKLAQELDLQLEFNPVAVNKIEANVKNGNSNAAWLNPEWTREPEKLVFSDVVFSSGAHLFSLTPFDSGKTPKEWVQGKTICTREGYLYPDLKAYFEQGIAIRTDVSAGVSLTKMLSKKRCDLTYIDRLIEEWNHTNIDFQQQLYRSPTALSSVHFRLALNKTWAPKLADINKNIKSLIQTGAIEDILQRNTLLKVTEAAK